MTTKLLQIMGFEGIPDFFGKNHCQKSIKEI